ncbi:antibiotic biosynthesis monooxygenase [Enterococcus hulanensis]|uniref:putative quinol monooxygenase n=1 Tax=Enterococcus hulanensis TaxID=2559929 RepID=UPI00289190CA|nr:antibiotic biosynthesis monooxygenase [Enterococcus hulanensis]MDT2661030.1 antibiotic biosynthesis monooxygenase [Enterococcus hulanensis]
MFWDVFLANPDNFEFRLLQDKNNSNIFILMEKWKSMDTVAAHGKRDYMTEFVPQKDELFDTLDRTLVQEIYPVNELE